MTLLPGAEAAPAGARPLAPELGVWAAAWKLLRLRTVIGWNNFRRARLRRKIGQISLGVLLAVFLGFIVFLSISLLNVLRSPDLAAYLGDTSTFLDSFPVMILSAAAAGILMTSFGVMLQALYLSGDMDFLLSTPIPIRSVFIAKLIQGILPNFAILCLFSLPLLFGLGVSGHYSLVYYPLALIVLAALTLAAAGAAALLVMVAARIFPAKRMAEVLGFIVGTFFMVFSQSARFMNFYIDEQQISSLLSLAQRFNRPWSPLSWAGNGLILLGKGQWLPGLGLTAAGLLVAGAVFYAALVTAERLYYTGWSSLQNNRGGRRKKTAAPALSSAAAPAATPAPAAALLDRLIPAPVRAIVAKDWTLYRRDLRNASRLLTPLILGVVYAVSLVQSNGQFSEGQGEMPAWLAQVFEAVTLYADVGLALFLGWMLAANLAGLGFSMEGKRYAILKAAPLGARALLSAKFLVSYLPSLLVCEVYVLVLQILKGFQPWNAAVSLLAVAAIMAGLNGIYLAFGVSGARFNWDNPNETGRTIGCLGSLAGMVYAPLCFVLFAAPPAAAALLGFPLWIGQLAGLALGGAAGLAAAIFPPGLVEKRVAVLMEE